MEEADALSGHALVLFWRIAAMLMLEHWHFSGDWIGRFWASGAPSSTSDAPGTYSNRESLYFGNGQES